MTTYNFYFGHDPELLERVEALHAEVLKLTQQRNAARSVAEEAVDAEEAVEQQLRTMRQQHD